MRTTGPWPVIATVCSTWAARLPSVLRTVRAAVVRDVRVLVHRVADAVAAEVDRDAVAGAVACRADRGGDIAQPAAGGGLVADGGQDHHH